MIQANHFTGALSIYYIDTHHYITCRRVQHSTGKSPRYTVQTKQTLNNFPSNVKVKHGSASTYRISYKLWTEGGKTQVRQQQQEV